ncbi:MAG: xanthine dehydrogenase family protein molybdopterin-binding subunit [Alphaproteobacteria bacterium]|nr:xanthine dehydrogenase family protein molybdopterin-binding subunit [Alphaproteobacteria bacterium]
MVETGIGASVRRKEDQRFLTGSGSYVDDLSRPRQTHGYFLRSPHAHARLKAIDTKKALKAPGVLAIFTGKDVAAAKLGHLFCGWTITDRHGQPMKTTPHPILALDTARYVGDQVAFVVAETRDQAAAAAELIAVDYEPLPAVISSRDAIKSGAPQVHKEVPGNLIYDWVLGDQAATDAAFAKAHHITKIDLVNNRLIPNAMEPRASLGEYDRGTDRFTLYTTSQNPHVHRLALSAFIQIAPETKLRVVAPDVGGGFGSKIFIYAEECVVLWASKLVGRPVKWTADRYESFQSDAHGRDHRTHAELAIDKNGKFLGFRVQTIANLGAYLSTFSSAVPTYLYGTLLAGQYATPAIFCEVKGVVTHTTPVDAYRGAGRPEATYVVERIVEEAARELKIDPAELRRRNFIPAGAFPYQTPVALQYDSGNYVGALDKALTLADYAGFAKRKADAAKRGKLRGIGFSSYIEACGIAPSQVVGSLGAGVGLYEAAGVRFNATGGVTVFTGTHSHGQGHETTFAQLVSDRMGVPIEQVEIVHGDTDRIPFGMGTYGSRSLAVGGSAIDKAMDKIIAKGKKIVAHLLEAAEGDIEFTRGTFKVTGTDRKMSIAEVAFAAYVPHKLPTDQIEPGLDETAFYDPKNFTFPFGTHICEVEVDPDTGRTEIIQFTAVDDFGNVINPMIVAGQVHGGIGQGIGQALLEACVYDEKTGQLLTGSMMDYALPRADDVPSYTIGLTVTPCPHNPLGAKGCGEAGAIAAPAAVMNAITHAIGTSLEMPATPARVWQALQERAAKAA